MLSITTAERAESNKWFFKTGPGEYGEGDQFLGLTVPQTRKISKKFIDIPVNEVEKLLHSKFHEERLLALYLLIEKFEKAKDIKIKKEIFDIYFKNIKYINNWDLVDTSAPKIVGKYLKEKYSLNSENCTGVKFLKSLVSDKNKFAKNKKEKLWEKRIGIVSTIYLIMKSKKDEYSGEVILEITRKILQEKDELNTHDLIQKAIGWMLREYGKRINEEKLKIFLEENFDKIKNKRTLLRYAIERLKDKDRKYWINRK